MANTVSMDPSASSELQFRNLLEETLQSPSLLFATEELTVLSPALDETLVAERTLVLHRASRTDDMTRVSALAMPMTATPMAMPMPMAMAMPTPMLVPVAAAPAPAPAPVAAPVAARLPLFVCAFVASFGAAVYVVTSPLGVASLDALLGR